MPFLTVEIFRGLSCAGYCGWQRLLAEIHYPLFPRNRVITVPVAFPSLRLGVATSFCLQGNVGRSDGRLFWAGAFETAGEPFLLLPQARAWMCQ